MSLQCPICAFSDEDEYVIDLHLEEVHFKQDSHPTTHDNKEQHTDHDEELARQLQQRNDGYRTATGCDRSFPAHNLGISRG